MSQLIDLAILGAVAVGGWYAYQKGWLQQAWDKFNSIGKGGGTTTTPSSSPSGVGPAQIPTSTKDCIFKLAICDQQTTAANKTACTKFINTVNSKCCTKAVLGDSTGKSVSKCLNSIPTPVFSKMAHAYHGRLQMRLTIS